MQYKKPPRDEKPVVHIQMLELKFVVKILRRNYE